MCDLSDPALLDAVEDIKSDSTDTNWILFGYAGKKTITLVASGTGTCHWDPLLCCCVSASNGRGTYGLLQVSSQITTTVNTSHILPIRSMFTASPPFPPSFFFFFFFLSSRWPRGAERADGG